MKLMIGLPWYAGPNEDTYPLYFDQMMYYGALRERSIWHESMDHEKFMECLKDLPPLNEMPRTDGNASEPTEDDWNRLGRLEVMIANYSRISLVGAAREMVIDMALEWNADYLLWWDADMRFEHSTFLRLLRHNKPVVGAMAFTAREPFHPVMYRVTERWDEVNGMEVIEGSDIVLDYPRDQLVGDEEVGGKLAMGTGVSLLNMNVFKEIPKPWFSSTGCGEDFFFSVRCHKHGIPIFIDTATKTQHKEHAARWSDEHVYWRNRESSRDAYVAQFGEKVTYILDGEIISNTKQFRLNLEDRKSAVGV